MHRLNWMASKQVNWRRANSFKSKVCVNSVCQIHLCLFLIFYCIFCSASLCLIDDIEAMIEDAKKKAAAANDSATNTMDKLNAIKTELDKINLTPVDSNLNNVLNDVDQSSKTLNITRRLKSRCFLPSFMLASFLFPWFIFQLQWRICGTPSLLWTIRSQRWRTWPHSSRPLTTYLRASGTSKISLNKPGMQQTRWDPLLYKYSLAMSGTVFLIRLCCVFRSRSRWSLAGTVT